jgi:hypothetical protein
MSAGTKLVIFAIVAISLALITASSFASSVLAATTNSGKSSSSGTGGTTSNSNSLSKKELKNFLDCVTTANKQSTGLSNKIVRDCYDKAKGIAPPTGATAGAAAGAGAATIPQVSNK